MNISKPQFESNIYVDFKGNEIHMYMYVMTTKTLNSFVNMFLA